MANYRQLTQPSTEPLTYAEVKAYLRLNGDSEETFVTSLIVVARQYVESQIWRPLISQTWAFQLDFNEINMLAKNINKEPLISIDSVQYYDANNALQTLSASSYEYDIYSSPPRFRLKTIPTCYDRMNTLQVNFTCGYANAAAVPLPIKQAMYMLIGHYYENRQDVVTGTQVNKIDEASEHLLNPYRNNYIFAPLNG
jgi:uncharacterized phiE125 gp8 family phage protein